MTGTKIICHCLSDNNDLTGITLYCHPSLSSSSSLPFAPTKQPLYKRSPALTIAGALGLIALSGLLVAAERRSASSGNNASISWSASTAHKSDVDSSLTTTKRV